MGRSRRMQTIIVREKAVKVEWVELEGAAPYDYTREFSAIGKVLNEIQEWFDFTESYRGFSSSHIRKLWKQRLQSNGRGSLE
jgi:hypothetical protein